MVYKIYINKLTVGVLNYPKYDHQSHSHGFKNRSFRANSNQGMFKPGG